LKRIRLGLLAVALAALAFFAVAPVAMKLPGPRLPLRETPRDYGLAFVDRVVGFFTTSLHAAHAD
jgi:hypothetical protein